VSHIIEIHIMWKKLASAVTNSAHSVQNAVSQVKVNFLFTLHFQTAILRWMTETVDYTTKTNQASQFSAEQVNITSLLFVFRSLSIKKRIHFDIVQSERGPRFYK
jgi:hypothetical protein